MFEKNTDEKSLSTESSWDGFGRQQVDIIIHQEQWQPTGGGITTRVNTTSINVSPVITSGYYDNDDTGHIEDTTHDKIETADRAVKVCKTNIVVRYFNILSLSLSLSLSFSLSYPIQFSI